MGGAIVTGAKPTQSRGDMMSRWGCAFETQRFWERPSTLGNLCGTAPLRKAFRPLTAIAVGQQAGVVEESEKSKIENRKTRKA